MDQIAIMRAAAVTLALALMCGSVGLEADNTRRVVVRLYDGAAVDPATRAAALRVATAIVSEAGVEVEWRDCSGGPERGGCDGTRGARDLVVRILSDSAGVIVQPLALGLAVLDPATGAGTLATIFYDRVRPVAQRTGLDSAELLGRAMAHEVGHLLTGNAGHARRGLMREMWTDEELSRNRRDDWRFAPAERAHLRTRVLRLDQPASN